MPNRIKPKRSYTPNSVPIVSGSTPDIERHELAINWADGKAYTRDASDQLVTITLGGSGGGTASVNYAYATTGDLPATGDAALLYCTTDTGRLYRWTGSVYAEVGPVGGGGGSQSATVTIPGGGDPQYGNVSLLLHGNGNTNDSGPLALTGTATNVATNATAKFGSASLGFDGTSRLVYSTHSAGWDFPADFTVEAWIYLTAGIGSGANTEYALAAQWSGTGGLCWLWYLKNNGFVTVVGNGSPVVGIEHYGVSLAADQWHHVAISRSSGLFSSYLNGSRFGTYSTSVNMSGNGPLTIGDQADVAVRPFFGRIDEFRITNGAARYTGDSYTVPAAPFASSADLVLPVAFA